MSDLPADYRERLDIEAILAQLARSRKETIKFTAEQHKLMAEGDKLRAEQNKLSAEGAKLTAEGRELNRETVLAPLIAAIALVGGVLGVASFIARFLP